MSRGLGPIGAEARQRHWSLGSPVEVTEEFERGLDLSRSSTVSSRDPWDSVLSLKSFDHFEYLVWVFKKQKATCRRLDEHFLLGHESSFP